MTNSEDTKSIRGHWKWSDLEKRFVSLDHKTEEKKTEKLQITTDEIEPTRSYATHEGKVFTSKSKLRQHYKEHGFRETGGEHLKSQERAKTTREREEEERRDAELIKEAYMDVKYGRVEFSEREREQFKREERSWGQRYKLKPPC